MPYLLSKAGTRRRGLTRSGRRGFEVHPKLWSKRESARTEVRKKLRVEGDPELEVYKEAIRAFRFVSYSSAVMRPLSFRS